MLSFPFALRWALAFHHDLALALTRITHAEIDRRYRRLARAAGLHEPRGGAFFAIQRFGSDLRLNVHLHAQFLDGAYGIDRSGREVFFAAPAPSPDEVEAILSRIVARAAALLDDRGHDLGDVDEDDRSLAQAYGAATTSRGTAKHAPDDRDDELAGQVILPTRRKARIEASTSTPRWPSPHAIGTAARASCATSSARPSPTTASGTSPPQADA